MKEIVKTVSKISLASVSNMIASLVRTKIFAILLGTFGVGVISQMINYSSLLVFVSSLGIPLGLTRYIAEWEREQNWVYINDAILKSLKLMTLISLITILVTVIFAKEISLLLLDSNSYFVIIILVSLSIPFTLSMSVLDAFLRGLKKFNEYVVISITVTFLNLITTIVLVLVFELFGFAISIVTSSVTSLLAYCFYFSKERKIKFSSLFSFDFSLSKSFVLILKVGIVSLTVGTFEQLSNLFIRTLIVKDFGVGANGIYQCVVGISNNYFAIFYMALGTYILPKLSSIKLKEEFNVEINNAFRFTILVVVPILISTFVFRDLVVLVLYSSKFSSATSLMIYSFWGDFFKALAWVIGAWLIPGSKYKLFISLALSNYFAFVISYLILNYFTVSITNVVLAYLISSLLHFFTNAYAITKFNDFAFSPIAKKVFFLATSLIFTILLVSNFNVWAGYILFIPVMIIWLSKSVKRDEYKKLFAMLGKNS